MGGLAVTAARAPQVSIGFIGAGFAASFHSRTLRRVHGIDVRRAAVASGRQASADAFARAHGFDAAYDDHRRILDDPSIDVVFVSTPNDLHTQLIVEAAAAGKEIVCEKPVAGAFGASSLTGVERARDELARATRAIERIEDAVHRAGVHVMYAENWVYSPAVTKIKRLIERAQGAVIDIRAEQGHSGSHSAASRSRASAGGGSLMVLGSHPIAAAIHLKRFESEVRGHDPAVVTSVSADVARLHDLPVVRASEHRWLVSDWDDVETWATATLGFSDGTRAVVTASFAMLGGVRNVLEVFTTNGAYIGNMTPNDALLAYTPDAGAFGDEQLHEKLESRTGWISASPDEDWERGYPQEMQDFMECAATGRPPVAGLDLALDVVNVIYAGYLSAETAQRVSLDGRRVLAKEGSA